MLPCAFFHADSNLELVDEWFLLLSEGALNTAVVEELLRADWISTKNGSGRNRVDNNTDLSPFE